MHLSYAFSKEPNKSNGNVVNVTKHGQNYPEG